MAKPDFESESLALMLTWKTRAFAVLLLLALGFLLVAPTTMCEQLSIKTYSTPDGLANNRISRIVRDSHGYLWFCTENGLSRFDGYRFTNYTIEDGLPDSEVDDLLETRNGTYWVATGKGLCRYNPKGSPLVNQQASLQSDAKFVAYRPDGNHLTAAIKSLYEDRAGVLWVGTWRGLYRLEEVGNQVKFHYVELGMPASEPQNHVVRNILEDRRGALWIATDSGLYKRAPDGTVSRLSVSNGLSSDRVLGLLEDRQGRIWIGNRFGGLYLIADDSAANRLFIARQFTVTDGLECVQITALYESADGRIWIGTDCGLAELLINGKDAYRQIHTSLSSKELLNPRVWSLAEDSQGNLWLGTAAGAVKIVRGGFTTYTETDGLGSREVCSIFEIQTGDIYVYTVSPRQTYLNRFNGKRFTAIKPRLPAQASSSDCWTCLQDRQERWWIATRKQLLRYPRTSRVEELERLQAEVFAPQTAMKASVPVFGMYEDRQGNIWVSGGAPHRLLRWDGSAVYTYSEAQGLPSTRTGTTLFAQDGTGNLWMGFGEGGLVRYSNHRFVLFTSADGFPEGAIQGLFVDSHNRLWIASSRSGLGRIDNPAAERPDVKTYTVAEGLSSNRVRSIVEDNWGNLYIGTDESLDRLDPVTGRIKHFTTADGLVNNQVLNGFRDRQGALWFGTNTGLSRFVPEPDRFLPSPAVFINRLQISGDHYPVSELGETIVQDLELASVRNNIQIDFVSLAFGTGEVLRYQYKLEGADQDWSAPSEQRTVKFANLAPGRYRFLVRATNGPGLVSEQPASFSFTILPPIWQRWWFVGLAGMLAVTLAYAFYRYRITRLLELERVRTRIASDLHDDIGANLTRIAILSEVAHSQRSSNRLQETSEGFVTEMRYDTPSGIEDPISSIAQISRESVASMSDIVWAINPKRDHLFDLIQRMRKLASEVLDGRKIECAFSAPDTDRDLRLGVDVRRNVLLIFKEAINNVARHSACSSADIELQVEKSWIMLVVKDNGRGFDFRTLSEGNGLVNMKRRADHLGGEFQVASSEGKGTEIRLKVPYR
jgi:ligand-binding sensor domain-containing protein/two-component sensor histidine kinase